MPQRNRATSEFAWLRRRLFSTLSPKDAHGHFDPFGQAQDKLREKSFLDALRLLGMTAAAAVTWRALVFDLVQRGEFYRTTSLIESKKRLSS